MKRTTTCNTCNNASDNTHGTCAQGIRPDFQCGAACSIPFLDQMLEPEAAAKWLGISVEMLMEKYRKQQIPGALLGHRTVRFNPRTIVEILSPAKRKA